jgi:hypothetical protein
MKQELEIPNKEQQERYTRLAWQVAPFRRLPFEVLAIVLVELARINPSPFMDIELLRVLLLTCRTITEAALSTPEIWREIRLDGRVLGDAYEFWTPEHVGRWISRCGAQRLHEVSFSYFSYLRRNAIRGVSELLMPLAQRLHEVEAVRFGDYHHYSQPGHNALFFCIRLLRQEEYDPFWSSTKRGKSAELLDPFHSLRHLTISTARDDLLTLLIPDSGSIHATHLQHVHLHDVDIELSSYQLFIQWAPNITTLEITKAYWYNVSIGDANSYLASSNDHSNLHSIVYHSDDLEELEHGPLFRQLLGTTSQLKIVKAYCTTNPESISLLENSDPSDWLLLKTPASTVTTLDLHIGANRVEELPVNSDGLVPFLEQFVNLEDFTFRSTSHLMVPGDGDVIYFKDLGFRLFDSILKMMKLKTLYLDRTGFALGQLLFLLKTFSERAHLGVTHPPRPMIHKLSFVVEGGPTIEDLSTGGYKQGKWTDYKVDAYFNEIRSGNITGGLEAPLERHGKMLASFDPQKLRNVVARVAPGIGFEIVDLQDSMAPKEEWR